MGGGSGLLFDWGMLFDSVALAMTYIWLCCGVLVLAGIPVVFVVLWMASKRYRPSTPQEQQQPEQQQPDQQQQEIEEE